MKGELPMRTFLLALAGMLALAVPAAAGGGGWATAGLGPPDDGIGVGDTWRAEVTVLQHGQTPLVGVQPAVIITKGDTTRRFDAKPTGKPGVYVAEVKFPSGGTWTYQVYDGFTEYGGAQLHGFKPVQIGPAGGGDGGFAVPDWTWALLGGVAVLGVIVLVARRLRPATAPVAP
jgi:hypothetical protein